MDIRKFKKIKDNIYEPVDITAQVSNTDIDDLLIAANHSNNHSARICFHSSQRDPVQRMLVALAPNAGFKPHRQNIEAQVSYVLLKGLLTVKTYDEGTSVKHIYKMDPREISLVNLAANCFRSSRSGEKGACFFEVAQGPFSDSNTEWLDEYNE